MPTLSHSLRHNPAPLTSDDFGYGMGTMGGVLVLRYAVAGDTVLSDRRDDLLHQLFWSPDCTLEVSDQYGTDARITAVSNSHAQRRHIEAVCRERGFDHVRVITSADATKYRCGVCPGWAVSLSHSDKPQPALVPMATSKSMLPDSALAACQPAW